jgi:4-hydroxy-tetrahydrodipicolinate reductase
VTAPLRIGVVGAAGRMGRMVIRAICETGGDSGGAAVLSGAIEAAGSPHLGADAGTLAERPALGVAIGDDPRALFEGADVVIDFTRPAASVGFAALAAETRTAHVIGTTGLADEDLAAIGRAARETAIVQAYNMSVGVNLLAALVRQAAAALDPSFDIEIVEMHHRHKVDAPSGTAILLGRAAAAGRNVALDAVRAIDRDGRRQEGAIGFASLRGGDVVGDHSVILAGAGERIELTHRASDRGLFARGALRAALWTRGRKPGLYDMTDVLGL